MSTNRPFFANFLAAFRAQSAYKAAKPPAPGSTNSLPSSSSHISPSSTSSSTRGITTKSATQQPQPATTAVQVAAAASTAASSSSVSNSHHSNGYGPSQPGSHSHPTSPRTHARTSVNAGSSSSSPPIGTSSPISVPGSHDRHRRGSDSSSGSGGFRDALGADRWYIGGQTATGEERYYPLGMVTKAGGRLKTSGRVGSLDQLSL